MIQLSPRLQLQTLYNIITRDTLIRTLHDFPPHNFDPASMLYSHSTSGKFA